MKSKILIVGSDKVFAIENFYVKYLRAAGASVSLFTAQSYFYDYYGRSLLNKLLFKASLSGIIPRINRHFKMEVERTAPDVIWIFKGMELFPESIRWARERRITLVSYNPDNPFLFSSKGSGNQFVTDSIALYHLHFTYNLSIRERLEREYKAQTHFLPFGYDLPVSLYATLQQEPEIPKVCFAGNPDKERAAFVRGLAESGIAVDVFGNQWERFIRHGNVRTHGPVYGEAFWKVLRKYRVQLNLMRTHNTNSHNMRTFEVPAAGGIMLAPETPEHRLFFADQEEVFFFSGLAQCIAQARQLLGLDPAGSDAIRRRARARSLASGYSYEDRAQDAYRVIQSL